MKIEERIEQGKPAYIDEWLYEPQERSLFIVFVRNPQDLEPAVLGTLTFSDLTEYHYERLEEDTWEELEDEILAESLVSIVEPVGAQDRYFILTDAREVRIRTCATPQWIQGQRTTPDEEPDPRYATLDVGSAEEDAEDEESDSLLSFP
jgi:hypothetical protein